MHLPSLGFLVAPKRTTCSRLQQLLQHLLWRGGKKHLVATWAAKVKQSPQLGNAIDSTETKEANLDTLPMAFTPTRDDRLQCRGAKLREAHLQHQLETESYKKWACCDPLEAKSHWVVWSLHWSCKGTGREEGCATTRMPKRPPTDCRLKQSSAVELSPAQVVSQGRKEDHHQRDAQQQGRWCRRWSGHMPNKSALQEELQKQLLRLTSGLKDTWHVGERLSVFAEAIFLIAKANGDKRGKTLANASLDNVFAKAENHQPHRASWQNKRSH